MREDITYLWAYARKGKTIKKKRIFAIAVAILMLVVSVVHVMAHDHEGEVEMLASNPCCSNPKPVNYIDGHQRVNNLYCIGTTYNRCSSCGYTTSAPYYNIGSTSCISICFLP